MLDGVSGNENGVRDYIVSEIKDHCKYSVDVMGNIIAFKQGERRTEKKVMLAAHMDEVGFIITHITDEGYLKFATVGGIDTRILPGSRVKLMNGKIGIIDAVAVHLLKGEERESVPEISKLCIDIGVDSREEAEKYVKQGDVAVFDSSYIEFGNSRIKSKALDDRFGCMALIKMIKSDLPYDTYFAFTVQEEVGLRGAATAAYEINPDFAVIVETTTAADINGVSGEKKVCSLGDGAVISYMDGRTIYSKRLYNLAFDLAKEHDIKVQTKSMIAGGNDAGAIQQSRSGTEVIAVSLPCRYIHSPSCVVDKRDINAAENIIKLIHGAIEKL